MRFLAVALCGVTASLHTAAATELSESYSKEFCAVERVDLDTEIYTEVSIYRLNREPLYIFIEEEVRGVGYYPMLFFCQSTCRYLERSGGADNGLLTVTLEAKPSFDLLEMFVLTTSYKGDLSTQVLKISDCKVGE